MNNPFEALNDRLNSLDQGLAQILNCLKQPTISHEEEDGEQIYIVPSAATLLNLKSSTVRRLSREGKLKGFKRGRSIYFFKKDLIAYLKAGERKTYSEVSAEADQLLNNSRNYSRQSGRAGR